MPPTTRSPGHSALTRCRKASAGDRLAGAAEQAARPQPLVQCRHGAVEAGGVVRRVEQQRQVRRRGQGGLGTDLVQRPVRVGLGGQRGGEGHGGVPMGCPFTFRATNARET
jgi:hypothetical protein